MRWLGAPGYVLKFLAAACFVVLMGGAALSLYYRKAGLALACGIVGAWSITMFFEVLKLEIIAALKPRRDAETDAVQSDPHTPRDHRN